MMTTDTIACPICGEEYCIDEDEGEQIIICDECGTEFSFTVEYECHIYNLQTIKIGNIKEED